MTKEQVKELIRSRLSREATEEEILLGACFSVGTVGHLACGICPEHGLPRITCGCVYPGISSLATPQDVNMEDIL